MRLLLTSAGLFNQTIVRAFENLVGLEKEKIHIVYIPTAANVEEGDKGWLIDDLVKLKKQGYGCIDLVDISAIPEEIWLPRLKVANAIFMGGGNTFYLISWLKKSGLEIRMRELLKDRVYVGISAGSMVATVNLRLSTSQKSYSEQVFPLKNEDGLGLVDFHIRPHLNSKFFPKARVDLIAETAKDIPEPIYAIDDNTAVVINDDKVTVVSEGEWKRFN